MAYDMNVARTAYQTAKGLGASDKVMLALFEAGIVESGFRNLTVAVDHDSVGFLQQRPSQGWKGLTNVALATQEFVNRAKLNEHRYPTAGLLAQSVQRSAFPLKYDAVGPAAQKLINDVAAGATTSTGTATVSSAQTVGLVADTGKGIMAIARYIDAARAWVSEPDNWARVGKVAVGAALLIGGLRIVVQPGVAAVTDTVAPIATAVIGKGKAAPAAAPAAKPAAKPAAAPAAKPAAGKGKAPAA